MQQIHPSLLICAALAALPGACSTGKMSGSTHAKNNTLPANDAGTGGSGVPGSADSSNPTAATPDSGTTAQVGSGTSGGTVPQDSNVVIPKDCGADGATQANLISKTLQNGVAGNYIDYQVFLTDCTGAYKAFTAETIAFDVNGQLSNFGADITFQAGDGASTPVTGPMINIRGTDLFNHSGPTWAHWETNKPVSFPSTKSYLTFRVFLGGALVTPLDGSAQLATYLKFGKAAAVTIPVVLVK